MFAGSVATALFVLDVACRTPDQSRRRRRRRRRGSAVLDVRPVWTRRHAADERLRRGGRMARRGFICALLTVLASSLSQYRLLRDRQVLIRGCVRLV